jgi:hypothetical protein
MVKWSVGGSAGLNCAVNGGVGAVSGTALVVSHGRHCMGLVVCWKS